MFFLSVGPQRLAGVASESHRLELTIGAQIVTLVTDGRMGTFVRTPRGFLAGESFAPVRAEGNNVLLSRVSYDADLGRIEVDKPPLSGRPVFYHISPAGQFFCSTHIAMLKKAGVPLEEDPQIIPEYFIYRTATGPRTLYKNIRQLLPGTSFTIEIDGQSYRMTAPTRMDYPTTVEPGDAAPPGQVADEVFAALDGALAQLEPVKDKLQVTLSGGLDSSLLFKMCQDRYGLARSCSASFTFDNGSEAPYSRSAAEAMHSDHTLRVIGPEEYLYSLLQAVVGCEVPPLVEHTAAFHLLDASLPPGQDVIVMGEGADIVFGLKTHYLRSLIDKHWLAMKFLSYPPVLKMLAWGSRVTGRYGGLVGAIGRSRHRREPLSSANHIVWSFDHYGSEPWVCDYFHVKPDDIVASRCESLQPYIDRSEDDLISLMGWISDGAVLQEVWSKTAERSGKVAFYPMAALPVRRAAAKLDWNQKTAEPKAVLRMVARRIGVPEFIITRPKSGFGIAGRDWALPGGLFEPMIPLAAKAFPEAEIRKMQTMDLDQRFTFWNMINYGLWKRLVIGGESIAALGSELKESIARVGKK